MTTRQAKHAAPPSPDRPIKELLRTDFARLRAEQTIEEALDWIREHPPGGRVVYFYVVDDAGVLCGVVPTRRMLLSPLHCPISDIMVRNVISLTDRATARDAALVFSQQRLLALPVVSDTGQLLGIVDIDLYTTESAAREDLSRQDDLFRLIGVHLEDIQPASAISAFRERLPWLCCNVVGGVLSAFLAGVFQDELTKVVALALFIPVVLALAESVSIQSVSLAIQMLHRQGQESTALLGSLRLESCTGGLLGVTCGLAVGAVALVWQGDPRVAVCILCGIGVGVTSAATIGFATPNLLRRLRRDPKVAAGPVALVVADLITLLVYFSVARALWS